MCSTFLLARRLRGLGNGLLSTLDGQNCGYNGGFGSGDGRYGLGN